MAASSPPDHLLVKQITRAEVYFERGDRHLAEGRQITWAMVVVASLAGVLAFGPAPLLAVGGLVALTCTVVARHHIVAAYANLGYIRDSLFDLDSPPKGEPGDLIALYAHPDPLPKSHEIVIGEVVVDDGVVGKAVLLTSPRGGTAQVPHGTTPFVIRKGDTVRFHRPGGRQAAGIWARV